VFLVTLLGWCVKKIIHGYMKFNLDL
jgi:hypothetical protein